MVVKSEHPRRHSVLLGLILVLSVAGPLISGVATFVSAPDAVAGVELVWALIPAVFSLCGALIVWRQPRNGVGWVLLVPGLASILFVTPVDSLQAAPETVDFFTWVQIWIDNISWMLLFFPVFFLLLIFPTGRLLSKRWRFVVALEVLMFAGLAAASALATSFGPLDADWTVPNPIGLIDNSFFEGLFPLVWSALLMVLTISGVSAVVVRYRRGARVERQQIKWLLLAVFIFGLVYALPVFNEGLEDGSWLLDLLLAGSLIGIPVAILLAVTRYRLYEIDRLVSRTLTYALVAGILAGFVASVAAIVGSRFQDPLLVAATTLAVAAMFNPLRKRIQRWVDRHFNRTQYDIAEVIAAFTNSLQSEVDPSRVTVGLLDVVSGTMQPQSVGLWVRT